VAGSTASLAANVARASRAADAGRAQAPLVYQRPGGPL
jgi:hypothetical protein